MASCSWGGCFRCCRDRSKILHASGPVLKWQTSRNKMETIRYSIVQPDEPSLASLPWLQNCHHQMEAELMLQVEEQAEVFVRSHILQSIDLSCNLCGHILPCWKSSMLSTNVPCTAAAVLSSRVQTTAYHTTDKLAATACNTVCLLYDKLSSVLSRSGALQQYMAQPERRRRSRQRRRGGRREGQQQKLTLAARHVCTCSPCLRWDTARTIHTASSPLPPGRTCI